MNAQERVISFLVDNQDVEPNKTIDRLIRNTCGLLNEKGYVTILSCSAHHDVPSHWWVLFVSLNSIKHIKKILKNIKKKYNYNYQIERHQFHKDENYGVKNLTKRWSISIRFDCSTRQLIEEANKNIYVEFENVLNKVEFNKTYDLENQNYKYKNPEFLNSWYEKKFSVTSGDNSNHPLYFENVENIKLETLLVNVEGIGCIKNLGFNVIIDEDRNEVGIDFGTRGIKEGDTIHFSYIGR